jgi:O-antigen ligase
MPGWLKGFLGDRIQVNSVLIVLCFSSVLLLGSQSAASYPSYLLALLMLLAFRRWNDVFATPIAWHVALLLLYQSATMLWSDSLDARSALGIVGRSVLIFTFVVALGECGLRGQAQRWLGRVLAVVGSVAAASAIVVFWMATPADGRLSGLGQLDNPVVVGLVFAVVLVLLLELVLDERGRAWRGVAILGAVFAIAAIWLSGSRNAWASASIGSLVLILAWRIADRQRFIAAVVALSLLVMVAIAALVLNDASREVLLPRGTSFRLDIWSTVIRDVVNENLFFGKGIVTPDQLVIDGITFDHPHSMYVSVLFQGGLVGLILFGVLIFSTFQSLISSYEQQSAKLGIGLLTTGLVSYLVDGHELIDKVGETWFLFWLPVGIALGLAWRQSLVVERIE